MAKAPLKDKKEGKIPKRDQILETAGKLFMTHGFQAVSMDQIAASVPVSKPTLYTHYKDKRALFTAVINARCAFFLQSLRADLNEQKTVEQTLTDFGTHFTDLLFSKDSLHFYRIMIGESMAFPEMARLFYENGPAQTLRLLKDYFQDLHKKKILNVPDPALSADMLLSMLKGNTHIKRLLGITESVPPAERKKIVKTAVSVFLNGHKI